MILATAAYDTLLVGASVRGLASMLAAALAIAWIRAVSGSVFPSIAARVAFFAVTKHADELASHLSRTTGT